MPVEMVLINSYSMLLY
uniref:Uncharacterized protein n=1 Tax=Arundo donax TaxID=35708 RepID=A0A0A9HDY9_ARUDO